MKEFNSIIKDIKNNNILPVYFLHGEEPFYIDQLSEFIENNILNEEEKEFNKNSFYANEIDSKEFILLCWEFPLVAKRKVVTLKEAQNYRDSDWENFELYFKNFQPTTILIIQHKYKKLDKRKNIYKILHKNGWIYESNKLYDNQIQSWILNQCNNINLKINQKSIIILAEFLGNDISKIYNELKKIKIIANYGINITPEIIKKNIGISKQYNVFEFINSIGRRDADKSFQIAFFFSKNEKKFNLIMIISNLFSFFIQLMLIHTLSEKSTNLVSELLKINLYFANECLNASKNYTLKEIIKIISFLYEYDLKSKGVGSTSNVSNEELLKELIYKILNFKH